MHTWKIWLLALLSLGLTCSQLWGAGSLYVSNYSDCSVSRYDLDTGQFRETVIPSQPWPAFLCPLIIGPDGNLYGTMGAHGFDKVVRLDLTTGVLADFVPSQSGGLDAPVGIAFGPRGNLFVTSQETHQILEYDGATGAFVKVFANTGSGSLLGLVFGSDNDAYAAIGRPYNQIRRYDGTSGEYKGVFASEGLDHPFGLTFGPDGDLYVVSQKSDEVLRFDGDTGQLIGPLPTGNCTMHEPEWIVYASDGSLYVNSEVCGNVVRFTGGTCTEIIPPQPGGLAGLAVVVAVNRLPQANAGPDQTIECFCQQGGTYVTLNGTGSSDPDRDPLTYRWTGPFEGSPASGPNPTVKLTPGCRGSYEITLVVNDGKRDSVAGTVLIVVQDTTAPSLTCPESITVVAQSPSGVPASAPAIAAFLQGASASDNCDPSPGISHNAPDQFPLGSTVVTFTATDASLNTSTGQATVMVIVEDFYLHGVAPDLTLDGAAPTTATPKYKDSLSLRRTEFKEIGTWTYTVPAGMHLQVGSVTDLHVWVGLKNSDDQGTYFDIRAEFLRNETTVALGEVTNIQGVTRNPDKAKEVTLDFGVTPTAEFNPGDVLSLRILTKVTTVGGHSNAVGLRLYYDSIDRPSRFKASSSQ